MIKPKIIRENDKNWLIGIGKLDVEIEELLLSKAEASDALRSTSNSLNKQIILSSKKFEI